MPKFFTKQGWLTPYAHACGYLHVTEHENGDYITLESSNPELNTFDVRLYNYRTNKRVCKTFEGIVIARVYYRGLCGQLNKRWENGAKQNVYT